MPDDFPEFDKKMQHVALALVKSIFRDHFAELKTYEDGHFRVIFNPLYFNLDETKPHPSKSQWSSLKKRLKRHHKGVFVFKATGELTDNQCYLDFGFFRYF
jgi:hypothetical protein